MEWELQPLDACGCVPTAPHGLGRYRIEDQNLGLLGWPWFGVALHNFSWCEGCNVHQIQWLVNTFNAFEVP